ncbi:MAG: hypothetical protein ABIP54_03410 [Candidatus Andersenbacteria bacterium]
MENLAIRLKGNQAPNLDELRRDYPSALVWEHFFSTKAQYLYLQLGFHGTEWLISYYTWFFDECGIPLDTPLETSILHHNLPRDKPWIIYPFDWIMLYSKDYEVVEFFLARHAPTQIGLDTLLKIEEKTSIQQRLIEAGARPVQLHAEHWASRYYYHRLACRAAAIALLIVAKRRVDLRGIIARELWRDMAERVWAQCLESFVHKE